MPHCYVEVRIQRNTQELDVEWEVCARVMSNIDGFKSKVQNERSEPRRPSDSVWKTAGSSSCLLNRSPRMGEGLVQPWTSPQFIAGSYTSICEFGTLFDTYYQNMGPRTKNPPLLSLVPNRLMRNYGEIGQTCLEKSFHRFKEPSVVRNRYFLPSSCLFLYLVCCMSRGVA